MENKKHKVLIVEDEPGLGKILVEALKDAGMEASLALNGKEGLEMFAKTRPDIILLDIIMPVMDGWQMLDILRQQDEYAKNVPVVILTNLSADKEQDIVKIAKEKPVSYIVKSGTSIKELVEKIEEILSR